MIVVIDNYDSFTYNLVQYLGELGAQVQVWRNDVVSIDQVVDTKSSLQFHLESVLTLAGKQILRNFLAIKQ